MRQILTRWVVPGSASDITTVMNFESAPPVADQRQSVQDFWLGFTGLLGAGVSWVVEDAGDEYDAASGTLSGDWSDPVQLIGPPSGGSGGVVPNASMLLIRWRTGAIRNGRRVTGRTFVPGIGVGNLTNGELTANAQGFASLAAADMVSDGVGFSVWSRPQNGAGGALSEVVAGTCWNELATQRRRRG